MSALEDIGLKFLHRFDPERAHGLSIQALTWGLAPLHGGPVTSPAPHHIHGRHRLGQSRWASSWLR